MAYDGIPAIEIVMGRDGLRYKRNQNLVPIGSYKMLRNATLEDDTVRTAGGTALLGTPPSAFTIQAAIDFWANLTTQRTLVSSTDGKLYKDDGTGGGWVTLATGLTTTGQVPMWAIGGAEQAGNNKKAFHCDRINAVQVLSANGASMAALANPPADWSGSNQPGWLAQHGFWMWGGGNANSPKVAYRSLAIDHENFLSLGGFQIFIAGDYERTVAALSYKGGLLVFCYPRYTYWIDTRDPSELNWRAYKVAEAGAAGPLCAVQVEDDVLWVDPLGGWHLMSATLAAGSMHATDISWRKLGTFMVDNLNLAQLATAQLAYYAHKQVAMLACHGQGQTAKNRRIDFDVNRRYEPDPYSGSSVYGVGTGDRWIFHDRDRNEALFIRKISEIGTPTFGDNVGQLYTMDRLNRNANNNAYTFEWSLNDLDFSQQVPNWTGRRKNGRFLQLEYDARTAAVHTVEVYRDGSKKQVITFALTAGPSVLPVTLPVVLGSSFLAVSRRRQLLGQAVRWGFRGYSSGLNEDVSIARLVIGMDEAA